MGNCTCANEEERNSRNVNRYASSDDYEFTSDSNGDVNEFGNFVIEFGDDFGDNSNIASSDGLSNISFEGESIISKLEQVYVEDEICSICAYNFDEDQHLPKILPCGHTICLYCIRNIARKSTFFYLECPLDRKRHIIKPHYTVRLLVNRPESSTVSLVSGESERLDTLLGEDLDQSDVDSENNILLGFERIDLDSTSSEVSEISVIETSSPVELSNYDTNTTGSCVNRQLTESVDANYGSPVCDVQQFSDAENEAPEQENDCLDLNLDSFKETSFGMHGQPINGHACSHLCTNGLEGHDKTFGVLCDGIDKCIRQKPDIDMIDDSRKRHDIYDDERSVRSFEWVEPDYSSESD